MDGLENTLLSYLDSEAEKEKNKPKVSLGNIWPISIGILTCEWRIGPFKICHQLASSRYIDDQGYRLTSTRIWFQYLE